MTDFIKRAIATLPVMDYDTARIVLMDLYETEFGICNHTDPSKNPLSSVLFHPKEEVASMSPLADLIEEFAVYNYGELFNISLDKFLELPRPYVALIRKLKENILIKREAAIAAAERRLTGNKGIK